VFGFALGIDFEDFERLQAAGHQSLFSLGRTHYLFIGHSRW